MNRYFISRFQTHPPAYFLSQAESLQALIELRMLYPERFTDRSEVQKFIQRFGVSENKIKTRGSELRDYSLSLPDGRSELSFFKSDCAPPALQERMKFYRNTVDPIFKKYYPDGTEGVDHLVHVSCTGYQSPSGAQKVVTSGTTVTHAYHMGCYASLPGLRIARGFLAEGSAQQVDLVHTEICTLHFDPLTLTPEQIVVQSLFADGHMKYSVQADLKERGFEILALHEVLLPFSDELMSWSPSSTHFEMTLSREVPEKIKAALPEFMRSLLHRAKQTLPLSEFIFAIHPGGPKILESVENILNLSPQQTLESHQVLENRGNMSSATLPHIWEAILNNKNRNQNQRVISLAFGPGLTMSGACFQLWQ